MTDDRLASIEVEAGAVASFRTSRLRAAKLHPNDAEALGILHADEVVMATIGGVRSAEESAAFLRVNLEHWDRRGLGQWTFRDATGALVGRGGLRQIDACVGEALIEVGYVIARPFWGRGFASEICVASMRIATSQYGLDQLGAIAAIDNLASQRVLVKCGFDYIRGVDHHTGPHYFYRAALHAAWPTRENH